MRAITATHSTEVGHLIPPAAFQKKRAILGHLHGPSQCGLHLAVSDPEQGKLDAGAPETTMHEMSPWVTPGSKRWVTALHILEPTLRRQILLKDSSSIPKPSPRVWGSVRDVRHQQVLCHLTCRQPCSLFDWACQIRSWKLFVFVLCSAVCAREQKCKLCRSPSSVSA